MSHGVEKSGHIPVLVNEVLTSLNCQSGSGKSYLDCTLGMGGHAEAILTSSAPGGRLVGIDRDGEALLIAQEHLALSHHFSDRITLRKGSFQEILYIVADLKLCGFDGILFDFGVSSYQLDHPERGFSFRSSSVLDMRMDAESGETASELINRLSQPELKKILQEYGEERWSGRIASGIIRYREEQGAITRTDELEGIIWRAYPAKSRHGRIHPATRTFQAIRMAVNQEVDQIKAGLEAAISLLLPGGRLVVISFHSIEDRCVKQTFKAYSHKDYSKRNPDSSARKFLNIYKKPLTASAEEVARNRRSRSAKLRALERVC